MKSLQLTMTLRDRIKSARESLGLNAQQMAAALQITPEWLSKIVNGKVQGSGDIGLRLNELMRSRGLEPKTTADELTSRTSSSTAEDLKRQISELIDAPVSLAGSDVSRLGWIVEQLRGHLRPPAHWEASEDIHSQALESVLAEEAQSERTTRDQSLLKRRQGGAG